MLDGTAAAHAEQSRESLNAELQTLSRFLINHDLDPARLEGNALRFALELATVHGFTAARKYVERNHNSVPFMM
jgi:hypothetical protein